MLKNFSASALSAELAPQPSSKPILEATPAKHYFFFPFARMVSCQVKPQTSLPLGQRCASTQIGVGCDTQQKRGKEDSFSSSYSLKALKITPMPTPVVHLVLYSVSGCGNRMITL